MNFRHRYDQKCFELDQLKARWDAGDKSDGLASEINGLLSQLEAMAAVGSRSVGRKIIEPDTVRSTRKNDGPFKTFAEQMIAIRDAGTPGLETDSRLFQTRAASGMSESIPSDGGFIIQNDFSQELFHDAFETGILWKRCRRIPITRGNSIKMPGIDQTSRATGSRWGGVRTYWADEATAATASKPKFRELKLEAHKMVGLCYLTDELMEDAPAAESYIRQAFSDEIGFAVDDAILNGTGAGQPLGILNAASTVSFAGTGGASTVVYQDVMNMWSRLIGSARSDSIFLINQSVEPQLYAMSLSVGSGGSAVYLPSGGASSLPYSTLFGRPVIPCEQCAAVGTTGDIILGAFKKGYLLGERGSLRTDMSIHVRFIYDESVFRFVMRLDGQPMLSQPLTPFKGSSTVSHFVKLDTR